MNGKHTGKPQTPRAQLPHLRRSCFCTLHSLLCPRQASPQVYPQLDFPQLRGPDSVSFPSPPPTQGAFPLEENWFEGIWLCRFRL